MKKLKSNRTIFATQVFFYLLLILAVILIFGVPFISTARTHLESEIGRKLKDIAKIAARNAPYERLALIKTGDDQTRMVLRLKEKLSEIREATSVENVFIFQPDGSLLVDLRPDRLIGSPSALGHFKKNFLTSLQQGRPVSTGSYPAANDQLFISAYAPVMDDQGRLFAVVGVDAGATEIELINRMQSRLYWTAAGGAIIAFLVALLLARTLTRPIRHMARTAEQIGNGDYQARVPIPSILELAVLANSLNEMARLVQARDAKLKEMSASVAHEIRNPLNSIKLLITLLGEELQEPRDGKPSKILETLHYEIGKLNRFLTEFLTYSRPITLVVDDVDPVELAATAVELAGAAAREKNVEISTHSSPGLPLVRMDRERMEQSLLNILLNAVEACDDGGRVALTTQPAAGDGGVDFVIQDTGPGISAENLPRLFEPFFTTKVTGSGLGLANVALIVKNHGGTISVDNLPQAGACFTIHLPRASQG